MQSPPRFRRPGWSCDQYLCIKPPTLLLLALIYLSRAIAWPLLAAVGNLGGGSDLTIFTTTLFTSAALVPSTIAFTIVYAYSRRSPSGSRLARRLWAGGQQTLALAAIIDCGVTGSALLHSQSSNQVQLVLVAMALDLAILSYVLLSPRVRAVFYDFPSAVDSVIAIRKWCPVAADPEPVTPPAASLAYGTLSREARVAIEAARAAGEQLRRSIQTLRDRSREPGTPAELPLSSVQH